MADHSNEPHADPSNNNSTNVIMNGLKDQDELRELGSNSSNASFPSDRHRSVSSSEREDFEKFGQDELAEIPRELLDFGNRMVGDVIDELTQSEHYRTGPSATQTPNNDELPSPISTYTMDERDLYVPPNAGNAEAHPIGDTDALLTYNDSEFDPLAGRRTTHEEELSLIPEEKNEQRLGNWGSAPQNEEPQGGHEHESDVDDEVDLLSSGGHRFQESEHFAPRDPTNEQLKAAEDEETYNRKGPLTIPQETAAPVQKNMPAAEEHPSPRVPPAPPAMFNEPAVVKPEVINSGPTPPRVLEVVYWRDPKRSAAALAAILFALYLIARCSVITLVAYTSLAVLAGTVGFRLFKLAEAQVKKSDSAHPFKQYLENDMEVPKEKLHTQVDILIEHGQSLFKQLRHLFLVESLVDSVKFGLLLYTLTYIGAWFSGITLILFFVLGVFSVPKIYELYKEPIDHYIAIIREHVEKVQHTVQEKLPFMKKLLESEKKEQ